MADVGSINPALGVMFHAIGGLAAASFYLPLKFVKKWSWEAYWITQGFASWIIAPIIGAWLTVPNIWSILSGSNPRDLALTFLFGALWGIGGLTFGLSMRFLGMSLGYSIALGFCAAFGTIIPPVIDGKGAVFFTVPSQMVIFGGLVVCLMGIAVCGYAGSLKEKDLSSEEIRKAIKEFALTKGLLVATFSGIMSACMSLAYNFGAPISEAAKQAGTNELYINNAPLVVILLGGFTSNLIWSLYLMLKNKTLRDLFSGKVSLQLPNFILCFVGGVTWYLQFFFFGMGKTQMSQLSYASWTIHMAFIIAFSNLWGILLGEWKGSRILTKSVVVGGIAVLLLSTVVVGVGYKIEENEKAEAAKAKAEVTAQIVPASSLAHAWTQKQTSR
jgi:L-rhamnose-H+ transport protein